MTAQAGSTLQTVRAILEKTAAYFTSKGILSARLDAELLLAEALGLDRLRLYLDFERPLSDAELERARELVRRRAAREPIAYILGRREFASRMFEVSPAVLVPRPETELLVEHAEAELKRRFPDCDTGLRILEFGTGSGAIAITLAANLQSSKIIATEISPDAAATARRNAEKHNVSDRIDIRVQPDFAGISGPFHAIVANPPYVNPAYEPLMDQDVKDYEPAVALFADEEGLYWHRFLTGEAGELLQPNGFLLVEMGLGQVDSVRTFAEAAGLRVDNVVNDYAGIERILQLGKALS